MQDSLLTTQEVAELIGRTQRMVRWLCSEKRFFPNAIRDNRIHGWLIPRADVLAYIEKHGASKHTPIRYMGTPGQ